MRRLFFAVLVAALVMVTATTVTLAAKPSTGCAAAASGWFLVDKAGWWHHTVLGFEAEGITVYNSDGSFTAEFDALAADFGFGDGAGLEFFVLETQWDGMNHNGDDYVCMKYWPVTPGNPAYFFGGVDNQASTKHGQQEL